MGRVSAALPWLVALASSLAVIVLLAAAPLQASPSSTTGSSQGGGVVLGLVREGLEALRGGNLTRVAEAARGLREAAVPARLEPVVARIASRLDALAVSGGSVLRSCAAAEALLSRGAASRAKKEAVRCLGLVKAVEEAYSLMYGDVEELGRVYGNVSDLLGLVRELAASAAYVRKRAEGVLERAVEEEHGLRSTVLRILVSPGRVVYGGLVRVRACLETSDGTPLAGRTVMIHVGGTVDRMVLGGDGCAARAYRVLSGRARVTVYAEYVPAGGDRGVYRYARSRIIYITVSLKKLSMTVEANSTILHPLDTLRLTVHCNAAVGVRAETSWGSSAEAFAAGGAAILDLRVPASAPSRSWVNVTAYGEGYAEASKALEVRVEAMNPGATFTAPPLGLLVAGACMSAVAVEARVPGSLHVTPWGSGGGVVCIPLTAGGPATLHVEFKPSDPRYATETEDINVYVINPIPLLAAAAVAAAWLTRGSGVGGGGSRAAAGGSLFHELEAAVGSEAMPWETVREYVSRSIPGEEAYRVARAYEDAAYGGRGAGEFERIIDTLRRLLRSR